MKKKIWTIFHLIVGAVIVTLSLIGLARAETGHPIAGYLEDGRPFVEPVPDHQRTARGDKMSFSTTSLLLSDDALDRLQLPGILRQEVLDADQLDGLGEKWGVDAKNWPPPWGPHPRPSAGAWLSRRGAGGGGRGDASCAPPVLP